MVGGDNGAGVPGAANELSFLRMVIVAHRCTVTGYWTIIQRLPEFSRLHWDACRDGLNGENSWWYYL